MNSILAPHPVPSASAVHLERSTKTASLPPAGAVEGAHAPRPGSKAPTPSRAFKCRCGRPVFFGNSECLSCRTPLGFDPARQMLLPLEPASAGPEQQPADTGGDSSTALLREVGASSATLFRRCSHLNTPVACNWLVSTADDCAGDPPLCRSCRLTRVVPDPTLDNGARWWNRVESAKRLLVASLLGLQLPVRSKVNEDPDRGLVFDLLRALPGGPPVITGHIDGVITIDVEEADDTVRETRRTALDEPYRTLLGHLRHETGHYYWQRLVDHSAWLEPWRQLFGDERQDYAAALKQHHGCGVPADWGQRFVSGYASCHPWEDWAETWAHYLHMVDTIGTARSFGLDGECVELSYERFGMAALGDPPRGFNADATGAQEFLDLVNSWMELTGVLNELSRSMGVADYYPFVLSVPALRKLHLVHRVITGAQP